MAAALLFLYLIFSCLFITISACGDGPRAGGGGFGRKCNHTSDSRIPFHRHNSTSGGRTVGESSGGFGQEYNHTNDSKIAVHTSNTAASNNCSIQSSNSTSTDSPSTGSIMINQGTGAFTLLITLTAIVLVMC
ncbi:hypothetical protein MKW98_019859 [Papaver atlanticum]|uniref:Uncharacterized protein n=1 Tax=Papaver atlanticum TaxID=357466 RepID=A0AAD4S1T5_9MAGN|nr:hypothetical protein MKW98_019859 [Papaver atlanticum]